MKGYVEKNLRKNETVQAKCHVTWTAFVPIILRSLLMAGIGFFVIYAASVLIRFVTSVQTMWSSAA